MSVTMRAYILDVVIKECCQFDVETRPIKPPADEDLEIEMEVDNGCFENVCCFLHASKK